MKAVYKEYRILGYSSSEIEVNAKPFLIVMRIHEQLRGYLLENWQHMVGCTDALAAMYVEDIVQDIRDQANGWKEEAEALFYSMSELCVGPVRTVSSGFFAGNEPELDSESPEAQAVVECSRETMNTFIDCLEGPEHPGKLDQAQTA